MTVLCRTSALVALSTDTQALTKMAQRLQTNIWLRRPRLAKRSKKDLLRCKAENPERETRPGDIHVCERRVMVQRARCGQKNWHRPSKIITGFKNNLRDLFKIVKGVGKIVMIC
ncbi:hypothetical protein QBC36DRAFT_330112 [Triangularia setosa]|uniref:Uncharacterized protein n=1 Tax=Triangularia setosa TaxID=2587417 RepID=A0AAN6W6D6_9PEZI|nr:hypothetical protein QBC36DRAFT_330112 [Podospora setosa]